MLGRFFTNRRHITYSTAVDANRYFDHQSEVESKDTLTLLCDLVSGVKDRHLRAAYCIYYIGYYKPFARYNEDTALYLASETIGRKWNLPWDSCFKDTFGRWCDGKSSVEDIAEYLRVRCV